jgi:uncharacterized repeat protein (TIGR03803 family)
MAPIRRIKLVTRTLGLVYILTLAFCVSLYAQKETLLHSFMGPTADGAYPYYENLVRDGAGNLYGTTLEGGDSQACDGGCGTVFILTASGKESFVYSFQGETDGAAPVGGLVRDTFGNLYGTTGAGGANNEGTIFEISSSRQESILLSFDGSNGAVPLSTLILDSNGDLFGTTSVGGTFNAGTVFKYSSSGVLTVLYNFTGGTDGFMPYAGLVQDKKGNLYGTAVFGGKTSSTCISPDAGCGVVFEVTPSGKETVLYRFEGLSDGASPYGGLVRDPSGNLYGTATYAGSFTSGCDLGCGVVFKIIEGKETVLHTFNGDTSDGTNPSCTLVRDSGGNLYGTTQEGGKGGEGTVFELNAANKETILYNFTGGMNVLLPVGGVVEDASGNLYGTSFSGGKDEYGTVYKITP